MPIRLLTCAIVVGVCLAAPVAYTAGEQPDPSLVAAGKALAFDRKKGNCLACHVIEDGELAGNSGPPLLAMQARFPDKAALRAQIWDPTARNPQTLMPPFGKHGILTDDELDKVVEYIYSL